MSHPRTRPALAAVALALVSLLAFTAVAGAVDYPAPSNPIKPKKRKGGVVTLNVCKHGTKRKPCFKTIGAAVKKAQSGDTIRVADGTYKEMVSLSGHRYDALKLVGNPKKPQKVIIDVKKAPKKQAQDGVIINGADGVTVDGFTAKGYAANGFFAVNVNDYLFNHLRAEGLGTYGLYAFNSIGGTMQNSVAFDNNDSGYYVGQTKPQTKPKRTILRGLKSYENVLGYSGTNSRYVTITDSDFYNNGTGIAPNVLDSEKYPPNSDNVISGNRVFWNNFDYYKGAPFKLKPTAAGDLPFPVGIGIIVFGGHSNTLTNNQVWGNYLTGIALFPQIEGVAFDSTKCPQISCQPDPTVLQNNEVTGNQYGKAGADLNGRDMFYNGNGSGNCVHDETYLSPTVPADKHTFVACGQPNVEDSAALNEGLGWALAGHEDNWIKHPHQPISGITPLETYTP